MAGMHRSLVMVALVVVNAGAAAWALLRVRRVLPWLQLPLTRRHLRLGSEPDDFEVDILHGKNLP
jgi:hypothetical protein